MICKIVVFSFLNSGKGSLNGSIVVIVNSSKPGIIDAPEKVSILKIICMRGIRPFK